MKFTDEMIAEDEKRWHARDVVMELGYCSNNMRDRRDITNLDIRFYAYIMRRAHEMLKRQEPGKVNITIVQSDGWKEGNCPFCGMKLDSFYNWSFCGTCGRAVKWYGDD